MNTWIDKAQDALTAIALGTNDDPASECREYARTCAAIAQAEAAERQAAALERIATEMEHNRNLESSVHDCAVQMTRIAAILESLVSAGGNLKVETHR